MWEQGVDISQTCIDTVIAVEDNVYVKLNYDDWLHRHEHEPLASMPLYVYAMYVDIRAAHDTYENDMELASFCFDPHYVKASSHVQVLLRAPRTPYLHGITVPSRAKDRITNALAHQILFRQFISLSLPRP